MSKVQKGYEEMEESCSWLGKIASGYSVDSPAGIALQRAALALQFVVMYKADEFSQYCDDLKQPLTPAQIANLEKMGLKLDSGPENLE